MDEQQQGPHVHLPWDLLRPRLAQIVSRAAELRLEAVEMAARGQAICKRVAESMKTCRRATRTP